MSTKDLEAYWEAREAFTNRLRDKLDKLIEPGVFREFLDHKIALDTQLQKKDQRAYRAVVMSAYITSGEATEILKGMFPRQEDAPPNARFIVMTACQRQISFELYRLLEKMVLDVANCLVPLKSEVEA